MTISKHIDVLIDKYAGIKKIHIFPPNICVISESENVTLISIATVYKHIIIRFYIEVYNFVQLEVVINELNYVMLIVRFGMLLMSAKLNVDYRNRLI